MARRCVGAGGGAAGWRRCTWSAPGPGPTTSAWARWRSPTSPTDHRDPTPAGVARPERGPVTMDAMGCQSEAAAKITGGGGDSTLAVKDNQPHLHQDIDDAFMAAMEADFAGLGWSVARAEANNRGREEVRECHVIARPPGLRDAGLWKGLAATRMLMSRRVVDGAESVEFRYFIGGFVGTAEKTPGRDPRSLGHRESTALATRCELPRGRLPRPQRSCPGELECGPAVRAGALEA